MDFALFNWSLTLINSVFWLVSTGEQIRSSRTTMSGRSWILGGLLIELLLMRCFHSATSLYLGWCRDQHCLSVPEFRGLCFWCSGSWLLLPSMILMVFSDRYALYFDLVMMRPLDCLMMLCEGQYWGWKRSYQWLWLSHTNLINLVHGRSCIAI